jgi:hypothetical protein
MPRSSWRPELRFVASWICSFDPLVASLQFANLPTWLRKFGSYIQLGTLPNGFWLIQSAITAATLMEKDQ